MQGIFLINKPTGITSHNVIDRMRQVTGERTIGHAGTLDPLASGLMIVAIGKDFTTQLQKYVGLDKEYEAEVTLGQISTTQDAEGKLTQISTAQPAQEEIEQTLKSFVGRCEQLPPIFSAKKIKGKKSYELARAGKEVELKPQQIEIFNIKLLVYDYPKLKIQTEVSSGTYIRSLAHDIGQKLRTGAYLSGLIRTGVGDYKILQAVALDEIKTPQDIMDKGQIV